MTKKLGVLDNRLYAQLVEDSLNFVDTGGVAYPQTGLSGIGILQKKPDSGKKEEEKPIVVKKHSTQLWEQWCKETEQLLEETFHKTYKAEESDDGTWITVNGTHILVKDGETTEDAIQRATNSSVTVKQPKFKDSNGKDVTVKIKTGIVNEETKIYGSNAKQDSVMNGDKTIGHMISYHDDKKQSIRITDLYAGRHYNSDVSGVGTYLTAKAVNESFERGYNGSVNLFALNSDAANFYEKLGFKKTSGGASPSYEIKGASARKLLKFAKDKYGGF